MLWPSTITCCDWFDRNCVSIDYTEPTSNTHRLVPIENAPMVDPIKGCIEMLSMFCSASFGILSALWCSVADTHIKLLDRVVSCARFLTGGVFECDIAHRRSIAVLCML